MRGSSILPHLFCPYLLIVHIFLLLRRKRTRRFWCLHPRSLLRDLMQRRILPPYIGTLRSRSFGSGTPHFPESSRHRSGWFRLLERKPLGTRFAPYQTPRPTPSGPIIQLHFAHPVAVQQHRHRLRTVGGLQKAAITHHRPPTMQDIRRDNHCEHHAHHHEYCTDKHQTPAHGRQFGEQLPKSRHIILNFRHNSFCVKALYHAVRR